MESHNHRLQINQRHHKQEPHSKDSHTTVKVSQPALC